MGIHVVPPEPKLSKPIKLAKHMCFTRLCPIEIIRLWWAYKTTNSIVHVYQLQRNYSLGQNALRFMAMCKPLLLKRKSKCIEGHLGISFQKQVRCLWLGTTADMQNYDLLVFLQGHVPFLGLQRACCYS